MSAEDLFIEAGPNAIQEDQLGSPATNAGPEQAKIDEPPANAGTAQTSSSQEYSGSRSPIIEPSASSVDAVNYVALVFRDGLDLPIPGLELTVTLPSGEVCTATTTAQGAMTLPIPAQPKGHAKIEVKDVKGKQQEVCKIDLAKCTNAVIISSPKVKADLPLRPHQQTPPSVAAGASAAGSGAGAGSKNPTTPEKVDIHSSWWGVNGAWEQSWSWLTKTLHLNSQAQAQTSAPSASTTQAPAKAPVPAPKAVVAEKTLNTAGQPVSVIVGPERDDKNNLRLGRNNVYRQAILDASKRLGLKPQALCALMDCEAGKVAEIIPSLDSNGKQLKDKKGHLLTTIKRELWNANAGNAESGAAGLTQFLGSTWLNHVLLPGYFIHEKSVANGWVRQEDVKKGKNTIKQWVFVLANGKTSTSVSKKLWGDANVKKCLAMRMDPTWSINAAADYGNANLKILKAKGFKLDGLNDMEKAKIMYLMHHEGEGAGPLFISNTLGQAKGGIEKLRKVFALQLGKKGAALSKELIDQAKGDVEKAYRKWLAKYIDKNFGTSSKYFFSNPIEVDELSILMESIGGKSL